MSHSHSTSASSGHCACGATCHASIDLQEMMDAHDTLGLLLREETVIATILTSLGDLNKAIEHRLQKWFEAVNAAETARANVALGTGMYLRPTTAHRSTVTAEERLLHRWLESEQRHQTQRLAQVQRGIVAYRAYLTKAVTRFQLQEGCLERCIQVVQQGIDLREARMEQLSQAMFTIQDLNTQWEQRWLQESARLDFEITQVPHAYQPGLQLGQQQRWSYVLTGTGKPVSQTQLATNYALRVYERQLDLYSQQSRLFVQTRRETWKLFLQQTETELVLTVLTAQMERWHDLSTTLMQPSLDLTQLASLQALITAFFQV